MKVVGKDVLVELLGGGGGGGRTFGKQVGCLRVKGCLSEHLRFEVEIGVASAQLLDLRTLECDIMSTLYSVKHSKVNPKP